MKRSQKPFFQHLPKNIPKFTIKNFLICLLMTCWVFFSIFIAQIITYLFFTSFIVSQAQLEMPLYSGIYAAVSYILSFLIMAGVPWLIFKKWKTNREELGLSGLPTWLDIAITPPSFILYFLIAALLVAIFTLFPWFQPEQAQDVGFNNLTSNVDLLIGFISLVIVAPIAEELIFRGWLYGKLRQRLALPLAIFLTSLLFGIVHGQWNVGINVFAMSIVLCLQREFTGTIYSGILLHMLKNFIAFYVIYIAI